MRGKEGSENDSDGVSREVTKDANSRAPIIQPLHVGDDSVSVEYVAES